MLSSTLRPLANYIFLLPLDKPVSNLIILPKYERKHKTFLSGKVIDKGPQVHQVNFGDEVAYAFDVGVTIELEGKKIVVIQPSHIMAIK